jgi:hypothetical protein
MRSSQRSPPLHLTERTLCASPGNFLARGEDSCRTSPRSSLLGPGKRHIAPIALARRRNGGKPPPPHLEKNLVSLKAIFLLQCSCLYSVTNFYRYGKRLCIQPMLVPLIRHRRASRDQGNQIFLVLGTESVSGGDAVQEWREAEGQRSCRSSTTRLCRLAPRRKRPEGDLQAHRATVRFQLFMTSPWGREKFLTPRVRPNI